MTKEKLSELLQELDQVVNKMDQENVSLEDSFDLYKKGIDLAGKCYGKLKVIEENIVQISGKDEAGFEEVEISKENDDLNEKSKEALSESSENVSEKRDEEGSELESESVYESDVSNYNETEAIEAEVTPKESLNNEPKASKEEIVEKKEENNLEFPGLFENH